MTELQSALHYSPGRFSAIAMFDRLKKIPGKKLIRNIASLMKCLSDPENVPANMHVLVAVNPELIVGEGEPEVLPVGKGKRKMPCTQNDVLVQVAAQSYTDAVFGLRVANAILSATCHCVYEVQGGQLRYNQEPFGFYHENGADLNFLNEVARIDAGSLAGGSWLLYQLYEQDLIPFYELSLSQQADVMGADSVAQAETTPSTQAFPDTAHTKVTQSPDKLPEMIRRGFPYRQNGVEGTAFVAASRDADNFSHVLTKMVARDALLDFTRAVQGGLYFVPPNANWLDEAAPALEIPNDAKYLPLHMQPNQQGEPACVEDYTVAATFIEYINKMRALGLFEGPIGDQQITPNVLLMMQAINEIMAGGKLDQKPCVSDANPAKLSELNDLLSETMATANRFNKLAKLYMTLG